MHVRILSSADDLGKYDTWLARRSHTLMWQTRDWRAYQDSLGRSTKIIAGYDSDGTLLITALVIIDRTAGGYCTWEIPRGPLWASTTSASDVIAFLSCIASQAKADKCFELLFSPMTAIPFGKPSGRHVQPMATVRIDLTQTEEAILGGMHQKGRYNIRLAMKHGVTIQEAHHEDAIDTFYELLLQTSTRDGFKIHHKSHYKRFLSTLPQSYLLIAMHDNTPIAGLLGVHSGKDALYYYGASSYAHKHLMAPYLLQWTAIQRAKAQGMQTYDLLGISPDNAPANDPWRGITDFKRKFGGTVITYPPEQMIVLKPITKMLIDWKRKILG